LTVIVIVDCNFDVGQLQFSPVVNHAVLHAAIQFVAASLPPEDEESAASRYVLNAARPMDRLMSGDKVAVGKSMLEPAIGVKKKTDRSSRSSRKIGRRL
jgi:UDP-glucose 6-dehydrogenase